MQVRATTDSDAVTDRIEGILQRSLGLSEFFRGLDDWHRRRTAELFDPSSDLLAPLKQATVDRKGNDRPLVRTGALRDAVLAGGPAKATDQEAWFGLPKGHRLRPLAVLQREGARGKLARSVKPPKLSTTEQDAVREMMLKFLMGDR